jgi:hypothetical protein
MPVIFYGADEIGDMMFKLIIGVVIGTLFADSIKKLAVLVFNWMKEKLGKYNY